MARSQLSPDADVEAFVHQLDLRAHHPAEQDVSDAVVEDVVVRGPVLLDQAALHPEFGGDRRDLPRVVRLDSADRDQRVGAGSDGVGNDVFELPQLVAAEREARIAVLPLGVDLDRAAEMPGQAFQSFDRGRTEGQRGSLESV